MFTNVLPPQTNVTTLPGNLEGLAEDSAHVTGDVGIEALAVRKDTAAGLAADGDYHVLEVNSTGHLYTVLGAGESYAGQVGGKSVLSEVNVTMTTAGAYAIADFVGVNATPLEFTNCARVVGGTGLIASAVLIDKALQSISAELWLFDATVTPPNDNAAWSISDADAVKFIGVIPFATYYASALNSVAQENPVALGFKCGAASTSLFGAIVTRGAPTYASGDLQVRLMIIQD